ncbi:MAG: bifunctional riboflavin kinase/FAD synthetase [Chitinophagaceae bacterium]
MKVHSDIANLPAFRNAVITIGTFDGVHAGHQKIISQLTSEAKNCGGESVIVTFHPHPRMVLTASPESVKLITTIEERIFLLGKLGLDHLVIVPFDLAFSKLSASEYVEDFLVRHFRPHTLIIGFDHRFGQGRSGDFHMLEDYASRGKFKLIEISQHIIHELKVSSTRIREEIAGGKIEEANELLGYSYFFDGSVVKGDQLGRQIGYPTANIRLSEPGKLLPGNGVYAVYAGLKNADPSQAPVTLFEGMMNIGSRPTVGGLQKTTEVNLFDFDLNIYDQRLQVYVESRLRDEKKFAGLAELKEQLAEDAKISRSTLCLQSGPHQFHR